MNNFDSNKMGNKLERLNKNLDIIHNKQSRQLKQLSSDPSKANISGILGTS